MPCARRALFAALSAAVLPFRAPASIVRAGSARGVYDLKLHDVNFFSNRWMTCCDLTVRRFAGAAVVEGRCEPVSNSRPPKKRGAAFLYAEVSYAETDDFIGWCNATVRFRWPAAVDVACEVPLPEEPALPIVIEGNGPVVSQPLRLPGGTLVFKTTVDPVPERYGRVELVLASGYTSRLWENYPSAQPIVLVVERMDAATDAVIEAGVPGAWRVEITEAFP